MTKIGDKVRKTRLTWFGHVQLRPVRKSLVTKVDSPPRGRGRPKKTWLEVVKIDM